MKIHTPFIGLLLVLNFFAHSAVSINPDQNGQAIIVPYFTVANNLNTLITINNTQDQPKAVKVNIRDGRYGSAIFTLNVYLNSNATWAFAMYEDDSLLKILNGDESCVVNLDSINTQISIVTKLPSLDQQTGSLEVIEMGNIMMESENFFGQVNSTDTCNNISDAWYANGPNSLWRANPTAELTPVSGGLNVDVKVIDVMNGFAFSIPTLALDNFFPSNTVFHTEPESELPDLSNGTSESLVTYQGRAVQTIWPTGYEAVSALIMKTKIENQFDVTREVAGKTDWVLSFPTLRFHKNNPETQKPFIFAETDQFRFPGSPSGVFYDRAGNNDQRIWGCILPPPGTFCPPINLLNQSVTTYVVDPWGVESPVSNISGISNDRVKPLNLDSSDPANLTFLAGKVKLFINPGTDENPLIPSYSNTNNRGINSESNANQNYYGLPVISFAVQMYRNSNAQPGLLASYAASKVGFGTRKITEENDSLR